MHRFPWSMNVLGSRLLVAMLLLAAWVLSPVDTIADCVYGPGGLESYYYDPELGRGTLNLSDGMTWSIELTGIDGSAVSGNRVYHLVVQDHGSGSGWETLPTQVHHDFYSGGGHLLQSDDLGFVVRSSHGFNEGDVPDTFDLLVEMTQVPDGRWFIVPHYRLPGGVWTVFFDGPWTTSTSFSLTQARVAVQIDGGGGGTLCFHPPTATWREPTGVGAAPVTSLRLFAYPNPVCRAEGAYVLFYAPPGAEPDLAVYNLAGERVNTLIAGGLPFGPQSIRWDGCDASGRPVAPGLYFLRLTSDGWSETRRVTIIR